MLSIFSGKHGKQREEPVRRLRSVSSSIPDQNRRSGSQTSSRAELIKSEDVQSLRSEASKYTLARTESLISDVLSFYSLGKYLNKTFVASILITKPMCLKNVNSGRFFVHEYSFLHH